MMVNKKPAILIVTGIFPPDIGGPATYVPKIAKELVNLGWKVTVITLSDSLDHNDSEYPFHVIRILRPQNKLLRLPKTTWTIADNARGADVIFSNGLFPESAIAAKLTHKPLVMKIVGDWAWERSVNKGWTTDTIDNFQTRRYSFKVELLKKIRSLTTKRADAVFTPSKYLGKIVEGWGGKPERLRVIYNAVDTVNEMPQINIPSFSGHTVITIARLIKWKCIDRIIQVISSLSDVRLVIVGDGEERNFLEQFALELKINSRIIFTGQIPSYEVRQYLRASDIFVLNSTYEGLPHIVLEAMSSGIPVIATDVGGTGEIVQNGVNGILIPPRNNDALKTAIVELIQNPDKRKQFAEAGYKTIEEKFRWENLVKSTEKLLLSVIQNTHKG